MISNPIVSKFSAWLTGLLFIFLLAVPAVAADAVGRFQFVHGTVTVERQGTTQSAGRGDDVFQGDTITTQASSSAQITLTDGARMALRPRSELVIDEYVFNDDDGDSSLVNLTRGGLRTVTGALGRARPDNVKIDTPVATMGIRGTDMDTFYTPSPDAAPEDTEAVLRVNQGTGVITSAGVELDVPAGTIAAAALGQPPRVIPALPPSVEALETEGTTASQEDEEDEAATDDQAAAEQDDAAGDDDLFIDDDTATDDDLLGDDFLADEIIPDTESLGIDDQLGETISSPENDPENGNGDGETPAATTTITIQ